MSSLTLRSLASRLSRRNFSSTPRSFDHYLDADFHTFKKVTTAEGRIILVDFYAELMLCSWCQPCKVLSPILEHLTQDPATETASRQPLDLVTINTDTEEGRELSQRFKVRALPTVVAFQGGKAIKTFTGALREHQVRQFLREI
ncbi:thioredoxin-like protein [Guyanagaster necrorhizus]|uniref:Thioredoxin-like protein n=1 Tax=Guyanagaster necrorhizus TaxID=856835 RepID=A0A9P8AU31_9AGAR|nr:thioredoxin-like protein [Guyanagaster necrorhizus MCA 3950]KAG7448053.1 thioredoxin-like protein [Guyanagaster necrorhizus MCA 3950]